jgi:hypothetical protein
MMPGGSPSFRTSESIEALYVALERLFEVVRYEFRPMTLLEFHDSFTAASHGSAA